MTEIKYKGYTVEHLGTFPMVRIKAVGQGRVPQAMTGVFTTVTEAYRAIDGHLEGLKKGKRNAKTKGTSTD